jgi:hypothetical protein
MVICENDEKCRRCSQMFKYGTLDNDMRCASCAQEYADECDRIATRLNGAGNE